METMNCFYQFLAKYIGRGELKDALAFFWRKNAEKEIDRGPDFGGVWKATLEFLLLIHDRHPSTFEDEDSSGQVSLHSYIRWSDYIVL